MKERSDNPELKLETALAHRRAGEIQAFLGDWEKSLATHQASAKILTELNLLLPDKVDYRAHLARSHYYQAEALLSLARFQEALAQVETGIPIWEELVTSHPRVPEYLEDFVRLSNIGIESEWRQHYDARREFWEHRTRSQEMLRRLCENFPDYSVEVHLPRLGVTRPPEDIESLMESERKLRDEIEVLEKQVDTHPDVPDYQSELAGKLGNLKNVLRSNAAV